MLERAGYIKLENLRLDLLPLEERALGLRVVASFVGGVMRGRGLVANIRVQGPLGGNSVLRDVLV